MKGKSFALITAIATLCMLTGGCQEGSQVKRLSEAQITEYELTADQAREKFYCGHYDQMADLIEPLCTERTTSQPLYLCELGTSHLACNNKARAKKSLLDAYTSIEGFFDPASEKKAMSLWGAEAEKFTRVNLTSRQH